MSYALAVVKARVALATHLTIACPPPNRRKPAPHKPSSAGVTKMVMRLRDGVCEEMRQGVGVHTAWKKPDTKLIPARDRLLDSRDMVRMEVGLIMASV